MPASPVALPPLPPLSGLLHTALRPGSASDLPSMLVPFVHRALALRDQVFVSLPPAGTAALRSALGRDADRVRWTDATRWHPHPMRRLRAVRELLEAAERHGVGRTRLIGECPLPAVPAMVTEWERADALLNDALATLPVTVVCIYDESTLPPDVVERSACSHPYLGLDPAEPSTAYLEPGEYLDRHRVPMVAVPPGAPSASGRVTPADARALVRNALGNGSLRAGGPDVAPGVVEDLALAVTELVTNAWQAGARSVTVACWMAEGEVGAQVDDDGSGLRDPLAGYRWPDPAREGGRGLWMARQLVDLVDVTTPGTGTSVRARAFGGAGVSPAR